MLPTLTPCDELTFNVLFPWRPAVEGHCVWLISHNALGEGGTQTDFNSRHDDDDFCSFFGGMGCTFFLENPHFLLFLVPPSCLAPCSKSSVMSMSSLYKN